MSDKPTWKHVEIALTAIGEWEEREKAEIASQLGVSVDDPCVDETFEQRMRQSRREREERSKKK